MNKIDFSDLPEGDEILRRVRLKKRGEFYNIRYQSFSTSQLVYLSPKKTGKFPSKEEALEWCRQNLRGYAEAEIRLLDRQKWRLSASITEIYVKYSEWRREDQPRSAQQDLSMLVNYGIPYFVHISKLEDPNKWGDMGEEFMDWLKDEARTRKDEPLAVSSCNKVINAINHFMKWMRKKKIIEYKNYRQFEAFDQRKQVRRGSADLVDPEVFKRVHVRLYSKNKLFGDLWYVQRAMGFRINELLGISVESLSHECPKYIREEFERAGFEVFGSIYLDSQPANPYIKRVNGVIERVPLKWRKAKGPDYARTIPILSEEVWNLLCERHDVQCDLWEKQVHGPYKDSYLIFDGAQRNTYLDAVREAYEELGLKSDGTHVLRHTLSTEWTALKIDQKVSELVLGHKEKAHSAYVHIVGQVNSERQKSKPLQRLKKISSDVCEEKELVKEHIVPKLRRRPAGELNSIPSEAYS